MMVSDCGRLLSIHLSSARIAVPEKTPLYATGTDILGMATAYHKDGSTFLSSGDWVNALAAFWYGYGWLHFGAMAGYLEILPEPCPFRTPFEKAPAHLCRKLREKSERYNHLLNTARAAVVPAPEQGTAMHHTARRVLLISAVYADQGQRYLLQGQEENALACFSYGHGWLDAAVRAGIFSITKDRNLFMV